VQPTEQLSSIDLAFGIILVFDIALDLYHRAWKPEFEPQSGNETLNQKFPQTKVLSKW